MIFAHRGASIKAPENTLKAFDLAIKEGANGIEFDIRLSADEVIVVIHDGTINRTSNSTGKVNSLTLEELQKFDFGEGEKIPTLKEVLEKFGNKYWLNIEIKEEGFELILVDLLKELKVKEKIVISSFLIPALLKIKKIAPEIPTGYLYEYDLNELDGLLEEVTVNGIHPVKENITKELVQDAHQKNLAVRAWTVDNPEIAQKLAEYGIDGIITNDPKGIIAALNSKSD